MREREDRGSTTRGTPLSADSGGSPFQHRPAIHVHHRWLGSSCPGRAETIAPAQMDGMRAQRGGLGAGVLLWPTCLRRALGRQRVQLDGGVNLPSAGCQVPHSHPSISMNGRHPGFADVRGRRSHRRRERDRHRDVRGAPYRGRRERDDRCDSAEQAAVRAGPMRLNGSRRPARPSHPFRVWYVREPDLLFGRGNHGPDPKTGIRSMGPVRTTITQTRPFVSASSVPARRSTSNSRGIDRCSRPSRARIPKRIPYLAVPFPGLDEPSNVFLTVASRLRRCMRDAPCEVVGVLRRIERRETAGSSAVISRRWKRDPDVVLVSRSGGGRRPSADCPGRTAAARRGENPVDIDTPSLVKVPASSACRGHATAHWKLVRPSTFDGGAGNDATRAWSTGDQTFDVGVSFLPSRRGESAPIRGQSKRCVLL